MKQNQRVMKSSKFELINSKETQIKALTPERTSRERHNFSLMADVSMAQI